MHFLVRGAGVRGCCTVWRLSVNPRAARASLSLAPATSVPSTTQLGHSLSNNSSVRAGLNTVLASVGLKQNTRKDEVQHRPGLWETRPLNPKLLDYAAQVRTVRAAAVPYAHVWPVVGRVCFMPAWRCARLAGCADG